MNDKNKGATVLLLWLLLYAAVVVYVALRWPTLAM